MMEVRSGHECSRCNCILITDEHRGELVCSNCGIVVRDRIEEPPHETRAYTEEEKRNRRRTGPPTSLTKVGMGLSTFIGKGSTDASGKVFTADTKRSLQRMQRLELRSKFQSAKQRNIFLATNFLSCLSDKLQLSNNIQEEAAHVYLSALSKKLIKGRSINGMVATSVYVACRNNMVPRTLRDIMDASNVKKNKIARNYRILLNSLDMKVPITDPSTCISRIANKISLKEKTQRTALKIIAKAKQKRIVVGKNPMGLAAAALFTACVLEDESSTQEELADASGITSVTLRKRYADLKQVIKSD